MSSGELDRRYLFGQLSSLFNIMHTKIEGFGSGG
jgi:hypothetical protein